MVSKKKRRFQNEYFDLDMAYITKRVIAMGYPASGFESVYRNSANDITKFFHIYHNDNVKIYNLCIEKERIYDKTIFNKSQVGLFPVKDHNPCPIKLILEFCVDICLYLTKNLEGVAAVHCKAGKGRTGVMICSYLIFSGLCKTSQEALEHYAAARTYNNKGVTIPSQIRYIQYFESFLESNFCPPYIFLIPKIIKVHLNTSTTNILKNFMQDQSYFKSPNKFLLKKIKVGPVESKFDYDIKICDFIVQNLKFSSVKKEHETITIDGKILHFFILTIEDKQEIDSDIRISVKGRSLNFYFWANLWYSSLNLIKSFIDNFHNELYENQKPKNAKKQSVVNEDSKRELLKSNINDKTSEMNFLRSRSVGIVEMTAPNSERKAKKTIRSRYDNLNDSNVDTTQTKKSESKFRSNQNANESPEESPSYQVSEPNREDDLSNIIYKLKFNTDLNVLIDTINRVLVNEGGRPFDKSDMTISLGAHELDKFDQSSSVNKSFSVNISYSLIN